MKHIKTILHVAGGVIIAAGIISMNLAIYFSSQPHYMNQGWAIFCGCNGLGTVAAGVIVLCVAESNEVAMRELDWKREHEPVS